MISLIALVIAFLTLLVPSQPDTSPAKEAHGNAGEPAMWAEFPDAFGPLLGDWVATVTLPEGDLEVTELRIEQPQGPAHDAPVLVSMGQGSERFVGPLAAHFEGSEVVFAGTAKCELEELGTATISGRRVGDRLTGTAYLPELQRLVTFTARPAGAASKSASWWR